MVDGAQFETTLLRRTNQTPPRPTQQANLYETPAKIREIEVLRDKLNLSNSPTKAIGVCKLAKAATSALSVSQLLADELSSVRKARYDDIKNDGPRRLVQRGDTLIMRKSGVLEARRAPLVKIDRRRINPNKRYIIQMSLTPARLEGLNLKGIEPLVRE